MSLGISIVIIGLLVIGILMVHVATKVRNGRKRQLTEIEIVIFGLIKWKMKIEYE